MGSNAVKSIVLLMVLVVLSFVVGAQVSDSLQESRTAFIIIGMIIAAFGTLVIGHKCWYLLFILPVLVLNLPYGVVHHSLPLAFILGCGVFAIGIVMRVMGHLRFQWRFAVPLDILVILVMGYMVANYLRYPTSVNGLAIGDDEYVGGKEYVWCVVATVYYIAMSAMPGTKEEVLKILKVSFRVLIISQILYAGWSLKRDGLGVFHEHGNASFNLLAPSVLFYIYASAPVSNISFYIKRLPLIVGMLYASMLNGGRENLLMLGSAVGVLAIVKREFLFIVVAAIGMFGGAYGLGATGAVASLPNGVARIVVSIPGVPDIHNIGQGARGSSETRKRLWKMALDPRWGFIKDYVWGDGFQTSVKEMERLNIAQLRDSRLRLGDAFEYDLARTGSFHNGFISTIHRLGLVGCVIVYSLYIYGLVLFFRVAYAYRNDNCFRYIMVFALPFVSTALTYSVGTKILTHFFACYQFLAIIKIMYCYARDEGKITPLLVRQAYVPMMIREQES